MLASESESPPFVSPTTPSMTQRALVNANPAFGSASRARTMRSMASGRASESSAEIIQTSLPRARSIPALLFAPARSCKRSLPGENLFKVRHDVLQLFVTHGRIQRQCDRALHGLLGHRQVGGTANLAEI